MPRRQIARTPAEEEGFQQTKRRRKAVWQEAVKKFAQQKMQEFISMTFLIMTLAKTIPQLNSQYLKNPVCRIPKIVYLDSIFLNLKLIIVKIFQTLLLMNSISEKWMLFVVIAMQITPKLKELVVRKILSLPAVAMVKLTLILHLIHHHY